MDNELITADVAPREGENSCPEKGSSSFSLFLSFFCLNTEHLHNESRKTRTRCGILSSFMFLTVAFPTARPTTHCHHGKLAYYFPCSCLTLSLWPNSFKPIYGYRLSSSHSTSVLPSGIYLIFVIIHLLRICLCHILVMALQIFPCGAWASRVVT